MKILLFLIASAISLFASYEKAEEYFQAHEYKKALEEAKASSGEYQNPQLHLLWAKAAEALGTLEEAMSAYERVLMLDEGNSEAKAALLRLYKKSGKEELANEMSGSLKQKGSLKATASVAVGYDTNINVNPPSDTLDQYYGSSGNEGELSTLFSRFTGEISYTRDLQEGKGWYLKGAARAYYQNNFEKSLYNLFFGSLEAGAGYKQGSYDLYLPVVYDDLYYLDENIFRQYALNPRATMFLTDSLIFSLNARYAKRSYLGVSNDTLDIRILGLGADFYYIFDQNFLYLKTEYETFHTDDAGSTSFINKHMFTASVGIDYHPAQWLETRVEYRFREASFDDSIAGIYEPDTSDRKDHYDQIELKLSHDLKEGLQLYLSERYAKNRSNYVPAEYSKNIIMLGIGLNY